MKKIIFGIITGIILCGGIVYAASYLASDISYTPPDTSWEVSNVNDALDDLYNIKTELDNLKNLGDATAAQILTGKKALVQGKLVTGTMIAGGNYNIVVQLYIQNQNSDEYTSNQQNYTIQIRNGKIVSSTTLGGIWAHSGDVSWSSAQAQLRIISITAV